MHNTGELVKIKDISARETISEKYLEQIISSLKKAGYVKLYKYPGLQPKLFLNISNLKKRSISNQFCSILIDVYDEVFPVENEDAFTTGKLIAKHEGIRVGISSGAALYAAIQLAKRPENKGKTIVALLPESGDRYYSTPLFV